MSGQDALQLLSSLLSSSAGSEQDSLLPRLRQAFEQTPTLLTTVYPTLLPLVTAPSTSPSLKHWVCDIMEWVICQRGAGDPTQFATQTVDVISKLLSEHSSHFRKTAIQLFTSSYPILFVHVCLTPDNRLWEKITSVKESILQIWRDDTTGVRSLATKFVIKAIQTQTRISADPRVQNRGDPNLATCPTHHPFLKPLVLEEEATSLLKDSIETLYKSTNTDVLSALVNTFTNLARTRPTLVNYIISSLINWTPLSLKGLPMTQIRSVEKTIRIAVTFLMRLENIAQYVDQMRTFLARQATRMQQASHVAAHHREEQANKKRDRISSEISSATKKRRVEDAVEGASNASAAANTAAAQLTSALIRVGNNPALANFDVKILPLAIVADLIVNNCQVLPDHAFQASINAVIDLLPKETEDISNRISAPIDPLQMDAGDADDEGILTNVGTANAPTSVVASASESVSRLSDYELPPPEPFSPLANQMLLQSTIKRIAAEAADTSSSVTTREIALPLLTRLFTRGYDGEDENDSGPKGTVRKILFEFIMEDFKMRTEYARLWLSEEWYAEQKQQVAPSKEEDVDMEATGEEKPQSNYDIWLGRILDRLSTHTFQRDASNKIISQFIVDLPKLSEKEFQRLAIMCNNADQLQVGFTTLRDLALFRMPLRNAALDTLYSLCSHSSKATRNAAIVTLKRWVPDNTALKDGIIEYAKSMVARLVDICEAEPTKEEEQDETKMETNDDETNKETNDEEENGTKEDSATEKESTTVTPQKTYMTVKDGKIVQGLTEPNTDLEVVQHVELLLALCIKVPDLLDTLLEAYPRLRGYSQAALPRLMTPLIQSMGAKHPKIISLVENCPPGAETLVAGWLKLLTENGKPAPSLVAAIKAKTEEGVAVSNRFLIPVISEFGKPDIIRNLPRVVSTLNGTPEEKASVKEVFTKILVPPSSFGTVSSNLQRERQSHLLQPAELMMLLHYEDKKIRQKSAIEAISICFSMTDTFKAEILAGFMQQVIDEPILPLLFMRTVIIAVTTYKPLQSFVAATLLPRLITKKIWTIPQLWEGFIRCARAIVPHSYGALVQLPPEQLREVVHKQPMLKEGLVNYAKSRQSTNKARMISILGILNEASEQAS